MIFQHIHLFTSHVKLTVYLHHNKLVRIVMLIILMIEIIFNLIKLLRSIYIQTELAVTFTYEK